MLVQPLDDAYIGVGSKAGLFHHHEDADMFKVVDVNRVAEEVRVKFYGLSALPGAPK